MDNLTFIVELAKALAWPVTVLIALLLFEAPLSEFIRSITFLRYKDLEVEFNQGVIALAQSARKIEKAEVTRPAGMAFTGTHDRYAEIIARSPVEAILTAWGEVEDAALRLVNRNVSREDPKKSLPLGMLEQLLRVQHLVGEEKLGVFRELRQLRNMLAHGREFKIDAAAAGLYCESAMQLVEVLNKSPSKPDIATEET